MKDYPLYVELRKFSRDDKSEYQKESDPHLQAQLNDRNDDGDQELIPYEPRKLKNDGKSYSQRQWRHDFDRDMNLEE